MSYLDLGVPGTQRRRWVSLAVENFGLGLERANVLAGVLWDGALGTGYQAA